MSRRGSATPKLRQATIPTVAADLPADDQDLYNQCSASWKAWKANVALVALVPSTMNVDGDVAALGTALNEAPGGGPLETAAVKAAATEVRADWNLLAKFLSGYIRKGNVVDAATLATSVLMRLSNVGKRRPKPPLGIKPATSGNALADALAVLNAVFYQFEWSVDQASWTTGISHTTKLAITGLTPGKRYWFRVKAYLMDETWTNYLATVDLIVT